MVHRDHLVLLTHPTHATIAALGQIAYDLNASWNSTATLKKYESLVAQLMLLQQNTKDLDAMDRFEILREFFFKQKQFIPLSTKPKLERFLLPYTLLSRSGPPELLLLLFLSLAEAAQLPLQVVEYHQKIIIKFIDAGHSRLFDFKNACQLLTTQEVLDLVNTGSDCNRTLEATELLSQYLLLLKTQSLRERSFISLYKIQTYLIQHQPFALNHFLDRARAAYYIGDVVKAAEDMGQYLAFHKDTVINGRLLRLAKKIKDEGLLKNLPYIGDHF